MRWQLRRPRCRLDYRKLDDPKLDYPKLDDPKLDCPKLDYPKLDCTKLHYPKLDEPKLDFPIECGLPGLAAHRRHWRAGCFCSCGLESPCLEESGAFAVAA